MSNVDRTHCCNQNVLENITTESDTRCSSAKTEVKKTRHWGWSKKRPDTPMINKTLAQNLLKGGWGDKKNLP